jgi:hypothetical protein
MPTLRDMIDNNTIFAGAPAAKKPSPVAEHVANHIKDPLGSTKEDFTDLTDKRLAYDSARSKAQMNLAPVQSVIDHASMLHGLTIPRGGTPMPGTPGMDTAQPGAQDNPELDENGNPIPPGQNGMPPTAGQPGQNGSTPNGPGALIGKTMPGNGNSPKNMSQTVGKMNSNRPSLAGQQPGVSPGPQESVRPPKLGMAQPGKPSASVAPNPQGNMYNKQAAPPKGNKSLPGAKGPGDPKVANKTKKAQEKSGREIKVHVTASAIPRDIVAGATNRLETHFGIEKLHAFGMGKGGGTPTNTPTMPHKAGAPTSAGPTRVNINSKRVKAGPSSLSDKVSTKEDSQNEVAYNPVMRGSGKCRTCGKKISACICKLEAGGPGSGRRPGGNTPRTGAEAYQQANPEEAKETALRNQDALNRAATKLGNMKSRGHALGAKKGWSTRGKGHLSKVEKTAHYKTMDA